MDTLASYCLYTFMFVVYVPDLLMSVAKKKRAKVFAAFGLNDDVRDVMFLTSRQARFELVRPRMNPFPSVAIIHFVTRISPIS